MVNSHVVGRCSFSGPNTSPNRKQPASYWDFSSHTPHDVVQYQPQMKTVYCFVFPSGNMIKKLLDWDNFNQTGWWWWFIREISMLFQAYRSKASHFSTTPSVGVPWISFPTMKKSEGRLLIQRLGIFLLGKLLVQTLRHFFCWTVCKHIKTPDVTVYQRVFRKIPGGFWAVSKAGTMASVRTSVKQSENSLDSSGERFALF